jgi:D-alanine-D-alanine ligase-like ATP-grasp enzyme
MRIGIFFGGQSREREISFAGGRTVYDNLNKSLFEPVPIFIDSLGNFILLNWQYIYKGTIRDFFPPFNKIPDSPNGFQVYLESLGKLSDKELHDIIVKVQSAFLLIPKIIVSSHIIRVLADDFSTGMKDDKVRQLAVFIHPLRVGKTGRSGYFFRGTGI